MHTCQKMKYKAEYSPSYLLDPVRLAPPTFTSFFDGMQEEYTWYPMQECRKELDKAHYACFAHPKHSSQTPAPQRGQRRRSWRNLFSSYGFPATTPKVPLAVFESLPILVDQDDGEPRVGSFSVRSLILVTCVDWPHSKNFRTVNGRMRLGRRRHYPYSYIPLGSNSRSAWFIA